MEQNQITNKQTSEARQVFPDPNASPRVVIHNTNVESTVAVVVGFVVGVVAAVWLGGHNDKKK